MACEGDTTCGPVLDSNRTSIADSFPLVGLQTTNQRERSPRFQQDTMGRPVKTGCIFLKHGLGSDPSDRSAIDKFFRERFRNFKAMGYQRRHVVSNIMFVSQSEDTAQVRANGVLLTTNNGVDPKVVTSMAYEGTFVKRDGVWKIQKWVVRTDTNQNYDKSNLPEGVRTSADVED